MPTEHRALLNGFSGYLCLLGCQLVCVGPRLLDLELFLTQFQLLLLLFDSMGLLLTGRKRLDAVFHFPHQHVTAHSF